MINISPKIVNTGLVLNLDPSHFKSYGLNDLPVKDACILWLDADDASSFVFSEDSDTVTITNAAPAVFTSSSSHNLNVGDAVQFSTTGALPGGIQTVVTYYVTSIPSTTTFTVGFSRQNSYNLPTNSAGSGTHTVYKLEKVNQWKDKSGNNNHASQASSGSRPSRSGLQNGRKSVIFDGINDSLSTSNSLNLSVTHTIFAVASQTTGTEDAGLVSIDNSLNNGLTLSNGSSYLAYFGDGSKYASYGISASTSYIFTKVFKGTSSTTRQVYLNGTSATTTGVIANSNASGVIRLGQQSTYLNGTIAEVIIFNRELTAIEVKQVNTYLGQKWGISNTDRSTLNLAGGFTNPWLLGNGTTANMPQYSSYNKSFSFDGITDIITYPNALGTFASYTFSFWARRNAESKMALSSYGNSTFYWFGDNSWAYTHGGVFGEKYYNKTVSIPLGSYGHYCVTYDGATVKIYRNGVFEDSQATTGAAVFNVGLQLGKNGSSVDYMFSGDIANFLMYSRALSATEVAQNYESQKARFASYIVTNGLALNLDAGNSFSYAGSGTTWYDVSGNNYSGSLINGPTYTSDNSGAIIFDGTNDYASISSNSNFNNGNNITVEAWVLCTNWSTYTHPMIVAKGINVEWILWKSNDVGYVGKLGWRGGGTAFTTTSLPNNTWVQCVGSVGSAGQKVYLNGILESTVGNTTFTSGNVNVTIAAGLVTGSPSNLLGANVAITRIYNRQLTDAEVLQNYNATKGRFGL